MEDILNSIKRILSDDPDSVNLTTESSTEDILKCIREVLSDGSPDTPESLESEKELLEEWNAMLNQNDD